MDETVRAAMLQPEEPTLRLTRTQRLAVAVNAAAAARQGVPVTDPIPEPAADEIGESAAE